MGKSPDLKTADMGNEEIFFYLFLEGFSSVSDLEYCIHTNRDSQRQRGWTGGQLKTGNSHWWLDVQRSWKELSFVQIWSDLVQRLIMGVKSLEWHHMIQIYTVEFYTQMPNLPPEWFILAARKLVLLYCYSRNASWPLHSTVTGESGRR